MTRDQSQQMQGCNVRYVAVTHFVTPKYMMLLK